MSIEKFLVVLFCLIFSMLMKAENVSWENLKSEGEGTISGLLYVGYSPDSEIRTQDNLFVSILSEYSLDYPEINTIKIRAGNRYLDMRDWIGYTEMWIDPTEYMSEFNPGSEWLLDNVSLSEIFVMEIGYVDYEMGDENDPSTWDTFHLIAVSDPIFIQDLYDNTHVSLVNDLNPPPYYIPWTPSTYYIVDSPIPEPSVFMLFAIGMSMLMLSRKK